MALWTAIGMVGLLAGGLMAAGALSFYRGRDYQMRLQSLGFYADSELPRHFRNAYLAYPLLALGCLAGGVAGVAGPGLPASLLIAILVIAALAFGVGAAVILWAPKWAKPRWFRLEEEKGFPILRGAEGSTRERMTLLNWVAVGVMFTIAALILSYVVPGAPQLYVQIGILVGIPSALGAAAALHRHRDRTGGQIAPVIPRHTNVDPPDR